jgi:hypothetical protein
MSTVNVKKEKQVSISTLNKYFNLVDGVLYWKKVNSNVIKVGQAAGYPNKAGYIDISLLSHRLYAHRIIFAIVHNRWPKGLIDHIDGDVHNNSPENLREVNDNQNSFNQAPKRNNTTGIRGVSKHCGGYHAEISAYKVRYRKWFKSIELAEKWVKDMREQLHGNFTRKGA